MERFPDFLRYGTAKYSGRQGASSSGGRVAQPGRPAAAILAAMRKTAKSICVPRVRSVLFSLSLSPSFSPPPPPRVQQSACSWRFLSRRFAQNSYMHERSLAHWLSLHRLVFLSLSPVANFRFHARGRTRRGKRSAARWEAVLSFSLTACMHAELIRTRARALAFYATLIALFSLSLESETKSRLRTGRESSRVCVSAYVCTRARGGNTRQVPACRCTRVPFFPLSRLLDINGLMYGRL